MARTYSLVGWDKYQHYGKREAVPWVKLHRDTLTSLAWIKGDDRARTIMVGSMALAARYQNAIPLDWDLLKNGLSLRCTEDQFMLAIRYLAASNFLAISQQDASAVLCQEEESREDEEKIPPKSPKGERPEKFLAMMKAYPSRGKAANPTKRALESWTRAIARGADPDELIRLAPTAAPTEKHGTEFVPQTSTWLNEDRWKDLPAAVMAFVNPVDPEAAQWSARISSWHKTRYWMPSQWGPAPDQPGCTAPKRLLENLTPSVRNITMAG